MQVQTDTTMSQVMASMVKTLATLAWANWNDELGSADDERYTNVSGCDLLDVSDEPSDALREECQEIAGRAINAYLKAWGCTPATFEGILEDNEVNIDTWAHYAIMPAVGHGVCWEDSHEPLTDTREGREGTLREPKNLYLSEPLWDAEWPNPDE